MTNFDDPAETIINRTLLMINQQPHRIIEIEFYYHSRLHPDPYCHNHPQQLTNGEWYFHRAGKSDGASYKGGTFKGLDITFGEKNSQNKKYDRTQSSRVGTADHTECDRRVGSRSNFVEYGGLLLRSIQSIKNGKVIEGPSKVVDHILELTNKDHISQLVESISLNIHVPDSLYLHFPDNQLLSHTITKGPRVGLSLKRRVSVSRQLKRMTCQTNNRTQIYLINVWSGHDPYLFRSYRYAVYNLLRKERWGLTLANLKMIEKNTTGTVRTGRTGRTDRTDRTGRSKYHSDYLHGQNLENIKSCLLMKTVSQKCQLYGYLTQYYPTEVTIYGLNFRQFEEILRNSL